MPTKKSTFVPPEVEAALHRIEEKITELTETISSLQTLSNSSKVTEKIRKVQGEKMSSKSVTLFETKRWGSRQLNRCQKCGWPWFSRVVGDIPEQCPKCGDDYWQREYVQGPRGKQTDDHAAGTPSSPEKASIS